MSDTPDPGTMSAGELIDQLCDEFERSWLNGNPVPLTDVVQSAPESIRLDLFRELLAVEREYRTKDGRPVTITEARRRFTVFGSWTEPIIQELLAVTQQHEGSPVAEPSGPLSGALAPRPSDLPVKVGGYHVVRRLGRGGMGVVYLADDPLGNRQVAIKVMHPQHAADPTARARFLREARSAMAVEHDHVVAVYQVGIESETPFLVMPALKGESLEDRLSREPLPPISMVLKIGREVALGLSAAHEKGLVHRDVKPANTWLEGDPSASDPTLQVRRAKVLDFGLARSIDGTDGLSLSGSVVGTPAYMAPEQAGGRAVDARADLFSLGAILYRMAAGRPAFSGPTITAVLTAIATHLPPSPVEVNPAVPPALSALIMHLLEKEPGNRPESAQAVAEALSALETAQPLPAKSQRRRAVMIGLAAGALLLGVGVWVATKLSNAPIEKPQAAAPVPPVTNPVVVAGPVTYKGSVDLLVHRKDVDGSDLAFPLSDVRAWPLKPGDSVKVTAEVEPAAFVYIFWIDETGATYPIYPWTPLKWGTRPASEDKVSRLEVKDPNGKWFKIGGKDAGMETLQMIVRSEPLTATDAEIQAWFRDLPPLAFAGEKAKAWFEGFDLVKHDPLRSPEYGGDTGQDNSPLGQQAILGQRIGKQSDFSRAISFSRLGSKGGK